MRPGDTDVIRVTHGCAASRDLPPREIREAFHWWGAFAAAAHLCLLAALYPLANETPQAGGTGNHLEAISVSIVPSHVLETKVDLPPAETGGGSTTSVSAAEGDPAAQGQNEQVAPEPVQESASPTPTPTIADDAPPVEKKPQPKAESPQGGAVARALNDMPAQAASASASQGEIDRYAVRVRAALARSKPTGSRRGGRVTVVFTIGPDGKAANIRVTEAGAGQALARAVQDAVARTEFPTPPAGMSDEQRTYAVPFNFR